MMENKLSCAIVRDLLPLFAEGLVSEETREAVEVHLEACPACREQLETAAHTPPVVSRKDTAPLKQIKRRIRLGEWLIAALSGMLVLVIAAVVVLHVWTVEYSYADIRDSAVKITAYDGVSELYCIDNVPPAEVIAYDWADYADDIVKSPYTTEDKQGLTYVYTIRTTMWNHLFGRRERLVLRTIGPDQFGGSRCEMVEREIPGTGIRVFVSRKADIRYLDPDGSMHRLFSYSIIDSFPEPVSGS